ncbi:hypothetical protein HUW51_16385 [Adhaeribacter swui]|uniref:Uncharacterized protein n=1 Tax=Adhaeribacter swui TaxID=2086471 RepID=A0A7G7GAN7_9BACT|nr:hypothetical protein [Adhaeribacter swui]QNF34221.1 hypothetical protein HUW51_16385 [Adhaeribacter swui]
MTLPEFQQNLKEDQAHLIWQRGNFLLMRNYVKHRILLYDMGSFYAEIWYHLQSNKIVIIRSFNNICFLEPYLALIDYPDLTL